MENIHWNHTGVNIIEQREPAEFAPPRQGGGNDEGMTFEVEMKAHAMMPRVQVGFMAHLTRGLADEESRALTELMVQAGMKYLRQRDAVD